MQKTPNWVKCSKCMQSTCYRRDWDPVKYGGQCSSHVQFLPVIVNVRQMLGYVTEFVHLLYDVGRKCSERLVIYCLNLHWTSLQSSHEIFRGCQDALDLHTKFRGALASSRVQCPHLHCFWHLHGDSPAVGYCWCRNWGPPPVKNPELTNVLPFKPGVGQKIAMHASLTARNFFFVLFSTFMVHSP